MSCLYSSSYIPYEDSVQTFWTCYLTYGPGREMGFGSKALVFIALYVVWDLKCWVRRHHCLVAFQGSQSFVPEARITGTDGLSTT